MGEQDEEVIAEQEQYYQYQSKRIKVMGKKNSFLERDCNTCFTYGIDV